VRFFNTLDQPVAGELVTWWAQISRVVKTNLNEEEQEELAFEDGRIRLTARPKEIVTLKLELKPRLLIDTEGSQVTRVLPAPPLAEKAAPAELPPVITEAEVKAERERVRHLEAALLKAKAEIFTLEDLIERTAAQRDLARQAELQRRRTELATLSRKANEARISALLNRQLFITREIEADLAAIDEEMSWSRIKKRAGEYLVHYYETLLRQQQETE
jgi:small-conductance mechanosensitive channel